MWIRSADPVDSSRLHDDNLAVKHSPEDDSSEGGGGGGELEHGPGDESEDESENFSDPGAAPVVLPIESSLDLHAFAPDETRDVVESYLEAAIEAGFLEVKLIHGRGIGVQREIVRSLLSKHPAVVGFTDAPPLWGGWGATIVRLRRG
jgi:dsDNA-specific endonuclease/ATPase MutS2